MYMVVVAWMSAADMLFLLVFVFFLLELAATIIRG